MPEEPTPSTNLSRRHFLGGLAGAALLPSLPAWGSPSRRLTPEEIAKWQASLFQPAEPITYSAVAQPHALFPTGGIGCGNVYVGVGGHLRDWFIFNNVQPQQLPNSFFAIRAAVEGQQPVARILQTQTMGLHVIGAFGGTYQSGTSRTAAPGPGVQDVEMRGEYPTTFLRYVEPSLPVEVRMEAFTPWAPLDAKTSAMPGTVFLFKMTNPGTKPATVSLLTALHNAAGWGEPGGNFNEPFHEGEATGVRLGIKAGKPPRMGKPVELISAVPGFRLPVLEKPEDATYRGITAPAPPVADLKQREKRPAIYWLEDVDRLDAAAANELKSAVESGATLVVSGSGGGLLGLWAGATSSRTAPRSEIVFDDFESGTYGKWKVQGTAFGTRPQTGTLPSQQQVSGFRGRYLVNSFVGGDDPMGRLTSQPFKIERRFIRFLVGGGDTPGKTCMNLVVDGRVVRTATGKQDEHLDPHAWDVSDLEGREAHLEIVDQASGGWGHINIDDIVFSDHPGAILPDEVVRTLGELLPVSYDRLRWSGGDVWVDLNDGQSFRLLAHLQVEGIKTLGEATQIGKAVGEAVAWRRPVGKGQVVLLAAPLLPPDLRGRRDSRDQALAFLAAAAGLKFHAGFGIHPHHPAYGEMALVASGGKVTGALAWENPADLWAEFAAGKLKPLPGSRTAPTPEGESTNTALAVEVTLQPGEEKTVPFVLTWHFPNYYFRETRVGNQYTKHWKDARDSATALARSWKEHHGGTERYRKAAYETTLPYWLVDCLTSQSSTIRSEVCVWLEDDTFAGYEGADGCCPMNCSHVWGYEQSLSRLFPDLERRMRNTDFFHQQRPDGGVNNRVALPVQPGPTGERPFADGHASEVMKAYREHLNSPSMDWLKEYWPRVKRAVEYLVEFDGNPADGVIDGEQWNTYDCAVYGPNTFIGSYYLAALRAGEEMAKLIGDGDTARKWRGIFESGQKKLTDLCWNGEYFVQVLPDYERRATQWGPGCLADQVIGQWWAHQLRLGYVLPQDKVRSALAAVMKHNWLWDFSDFRHNQRVYADMHDKGLLNCTWPRGGRPPRPILYCDEVWTGVEYQVAGHMIYEGMVEEAFTIVRGARERYDGRRRNPWNELECGGHYARAMSSWGMLLGLSGFHQDGPKGVLAFDPIYKPEQFRSMFTAAEGWGSFAQHRDGGKQRNELRVDHGQVRLATLELGITGAPEKVTVRNGGKQVPVSLHLAQRKLGLAFDQGFVLGSGETLTVELG